jgi:peptidoglycan/xylan/chitin deacetylase (PgdA/CDA1 family)
MPTRREIRRRRAIALIAVVVVIAVAVAVALAACGAGSKHHPSQATRPVRHHRSHRPREPTPERLTLPSPLPARTVTVPILMYHRIDTLSSSLPSLTRALTVDPRDFSAQMHWLVAHGFHGITQLQLYDALMKGTPLPMRPVMITFDDGYRDVFGKASTTLTRLGLHATAYVITDRISGPDASFLTWSLLKGLERRGIEIGSHTIHHVELPTLSSAQAMQELVGSRRLLERRLGHPVQWLAYPAGKVDSRIVELARRAGYVLAMTTQPGTTQSASQPFLLHRYEIQDTTGVGGVSAILSNVQY